MGKIQPTVVYSLWKFNHLFGIILKHNEFRDRRTLNILQLLDFVLILGCNHSTDLKRVAQFYVNNGQLGQHHMVMHFLGEGIQTKINDASLRMVGDRAAESTNFKRLRHRLRPENIESDSNYDSASAPV